MKKITLKSYCAGLGFLLIVCLAAPSAALAAGRLGLDKAEALATANGLFMGNAKTAIFFILLWLFSLAAVIALAALIWAGFLYITSFTNEDNIKKAKHVALYAIIGLIIMVGAFVILNLIKENFTT